MMLDALLAVLKDRGCGGWLVGGTVRDRELGRSSPDVDVVVDDDPEAVAAAVADFVGRPWFPLSQEWGAYRVVAEEGHLDIAALRGGSLSADLALRDFTINAMALPLGGGSVVDPYDGRRHLAEGRLVAVSPTIFIDDPLRLLRAVRLGHAMGLGMEGALRAMIRRDAWRLDRVAAERVLSEVVLTLDAGHSAAAVAAWDDLALLEVFLPEVRALKEVTQSAFHHRDAYGHTLEAMDRVDDVMADPGRLFGRSWELLYTRLGEPVDGAMPRKVALRLATLLHDVGKPQTRAVEPSGRILFWGHTEVGGTLAGDICRRLRCSGSATSLIRRVTEQHLALGFLRHEEPISPRAEVRYLWATAPWEPEVIMVSVADRLATLGPLTGEAAVAGHLAVARGLMDRWRRRTEEGVSSPPVDGNELMEALGLLPGPLLGEVVREVRLAWECGEIAEVADALTVARAFLENLRRGRA